MLCLQNIVYLISNTSYLVTMHIIIDIMIKLLFSLKYFPVNKCNPPRTIANSTVFVNSLTYNGVAKYTCTYGYKNHSGHAELICNGTHWLGSPLSCKEILCEPPQNIYHSSFESTGNRMNSRAIYTCDLGYEPNGLYIGSVANCLHTGQWSRTNFSCRLVTCGQPETARDIHVTVTDVHYTSNYSVSCVKGHTLISANQTTSTCQSNGKWTEVDIQCEAVVCDLKDIETNKSEFMYDSPSHKYGDIVTSGCLSGHVVISGDTSRTCQHDSTWSGDVIQCKEITCPPPLAIFGGDFSYDTLRYNGTLTSTCDSGFEAVSGNKIRTCGVFEKWSGFGLVCKEILCPPSSEAIPDHVTRFTNGRRVTDALVYICHVGYQLCRGCSSSQVCQDNGSWSANVPSCHVIECTNPPLIENAFTSEIRANYSQSIQYTCNKGFHLVSGQGRLFCSASKSWIGKEDIHCKGIECAYPSEGLHSFTLFSSREVGDIAEYKCTENGDFPFVKISGNHSRTCTLSGQWSGVALNCGIIECKTPNLIANSSNYILKGQLTQTYIYKCRPGFIQVSGNTTRICQTNGLWLGEDIVCQESDVDFFEIFVPEDEPPSTEQEKMHVKIGYLKSDQRASSVVTGVLWGCMFSVITLAMVAMDTPVLILHVKTMMIRNVKSMFATTMSQTDESGR